MAIFFHMEQPFKLLRIEKIYILTYFNKFKNSFLSVLVGVDVILNSLSEEKLQASIRILAQHGRFLEIGKFDLSNNTPLGMYVVIPEMILILFKH